ncbi:probable beta-D-xylosidase 7 [Clonorchis sinensis]|uniref:Probable beta-D-xylosidase 7 n=1 Tax=Clonorchis sinensis TaxID=79923 RepID=H2KQB5_CLOSI|nr:probable beta-D-xylosidase 7 [Clonorchis sinensis]
MCESLNCARMEACLILAVVILSIQGEHPFRNPSLPANFRVDDLLARLTNEELIQQVSNGGAGPQHGPAPGIARLNISAYQWRTNPGDGRITPFPQPVNLGATFDVHTVYRVARATGLEMRARWNRAKAKKTYRDGNGIHLFAPVVNLLRHPLWGRNQETFGEDPFMIGKLARTFVRGLGGWKNAEPQSLDEQNLSSQPDVLLVGANCKHFAVHTGPEDFPVSRLSFEANVTDVDLWQTYLPAFRACLEAGAVSVMCAYSGINGTPDCINHWLLTELLRQKWKFKGFVVTDCGALQFVIWKHQIFNHYNETAMAAVRAGVNLENSVVYATEVFSTLPHLLASGSLSRDQLIEMARPLFLTRLMQGEFNPVEMDPYRLLAPEEAILNEDHRRVALATTARSIVLLQNRDRFLPLKNNMSDSGGPLRHIAIVGPFATSVTELYGHYRTAPEPEIEVPLSKGLSQLSRRMHASDICTDGGRCSSLNDDALHSTLGYDDLDLIVLSLGTGSEVEGENVDRQNITLPGKQPELLEETLKLSSGLGNSGLSKRTVPIILLVFSAGPINISRAVENENVKAIFWCGFPGPLVGDAMRHLLLGSSGELFGPSKPISVGFHSFQEAYRWDVTPDDGYWWIPAARLPFTWYESIDQLANITVYEMTNQTYRYLPTQCHMSSEDCKIPVLYPFGYGLSYNFNLSGASGFVYSDLIAPSSAVSSNQRIVFYVTVQNEGPIACEEVVQVYTKWLNRTENDNSRNGPLIQLAGFERVRLDVGEYKQLKFTLIPSEHLAVWSLSENTMIPGRGVLQISVGGQQPNQRISVGSNLLSASLEIL